MHPLQEVTFGETRQLLLPLKESSPSEELLMSQVVQQAAPTRLLIEKGIFTKEKLPEIVKLVNKEDAI